VIHFGDPAFDLGFSLTHLLSKARYLTGMRGAFLSAAGSYWQVYRGRLSEEARRAFGQDFEQRVVAHTMGCLLARAQGRSQLEYLSHEEKERQTRAVTEMLLHRPPSVDELISRFGARIEEQE